MNSNTKKFLFITILIGILSTIFIDASFAADAVTTTAPTWGYNLSYNTNNVSIYDWEFSYEWFLAKFIWYYKWIVLWMTLLNIIVSSFLALNLMGASDNESRSKFKSSLWNVNASYFTLLFLWGLVAMSVGLISPKVSDLNSANTSLKHWTAFNDISPNNDWSNSVNKRALNTSTEISTLQDAVRNSYQPAVNKWEFDQNTVNKYMASVSNVYNAISQTDKATANQILSLPTAYADATATKTILEKIQDGVKNWTINKEDALNFATIIDSGILNGNKVDISSINQ